MRSLHTACTESQLLSGEVLQGRVLENEYTKPHDAKETKRQAKQLLDTVLMMVATAYALDTYTETHHNEGLWERGKRINQSRLWTAKVC